MILELVSTFGVPTETTHALYLAGSWPTTAANTQPAICGKVAPRGWELLHAGDREPSCDICLLILRGQIGRALDVQRSRDVVVPKVKPDEECGNLFSLRQRPPFAVTL